MKRILITIAVLVLVMGGCRKESDFSERFSTMFLPDSINVSEMACGTEEDRDVNRLHELYFKEGQVLTMNLNIIYLANGNYDVPDSVFYLRVEQANNFFKEVGANIAFELVHLKKVYCTPEYDTLALKFIEKVEFVQSDGKPMKSLRSQYKLEHIRFWNRVYKQDNCINAFVINDPRASIAGLAGGLGSTFFGTQLDYFGTEYRTIEHEVFHAVGALRHTHTRDISKKGLNSISGDLICDIPKSPTLSGLVSDSCRLLENWKRMVELEYYKSSNDPQLLTTMSDSTLQVIISNVMSYTRGICRTSLSNEQNKMIMKTLETTADLRETVQGLEKTLDDELWTEFEKL